MTELFDKTDFKINNSGIYPFRLTHDRTQNGTAVNYRDRFPCLENTAERRSFHLLVSEADVKA
jgi:hypothetical protein